MWKLNASLHEWFFMVKFQTYGIQLFIVPLFPDDIDKIWDRKKLVQLRIRIASLHGSERISESQAEAVWACNNI